MEFPLDFVGGALVGRRDSVPRPGSLGYTAWAAAGPRFESALGACPRWVWVGEGLSPPDRVALRCFLPKDALVEGVMESAESQPISLMNTS